MKLDIKTKMIASGIAAIGIVLSHTLPVSFWPSLRYFTFGYLFVGVFFFYSGYGLAFSVCNKKNYLGSFIHKKIVNIYIPFVIAQLLYFLMAYLLGIESFSWKCILSLFGFGLINPVLWYVIEIILLYIMFFISEKLKLYSDLYYIVLISIFVLLLVILDIKYNIGTKCYISTFEFSIGFIVGNERTSSKIKTQIFKFLYGSKRQLALMTFIIAGIIIINSNANILDTFLGDKIIKTTYFVVALQILGGVLFVPVFISLICSVQKLFNEKSIMNELLVTTGHISYEIYLLHMIFKMLADYIFPCNTPGRALLNLIMIFACTFTVSILMQKSTKALTKYSI